MLRKAHFHGISDLDSEFSEDFEVTVFIFQEGIWKTVIVGSCVALCSTHRSKEDESVSEQADFAIFCFFHNPGLWISLYLEWEWPDPSPTGYLLYERCNSPTEVTGEAYVCN